MKVKTTELTGAALDWAVAKCEGVTVLPKRRGGHYVTLNRGNTVLLRYSTDWAQGGPIIERENVHLFQQESTTEWTASLPRGNKVGWRILQYGPTPLIAAMRCYVANKLGDTVDVPDELIEETPCKT